MFNYFKDFLEKIIYYIQENIKTNKSLVYYIIPIVTIIGLMFFINSKTIFNDNNIKIRNTPLNEYVTTDHLKAKIISRKYNPILKTVEFIIWVNDDTSSCKDSINFELREQSNPRNKIPVRFQKIDSNYYVILSKVPKKWKVLSLSIGYENNDINTSNLGLDDINLDEIDSSKTLDKPLKSIVRIYTDAKEITKSSFMLEKKKNKYISEIMDLEIELIQSEISKLEKLIDKDNSKIKDTDSKILELKSNMKYQTESEKNNTNSNINRLKSLIETTQNLGEKRLNDIKELKDKIKKLEQKKRDFGI